MLNLQDYIDSMNKFYSTLPSSVDELKELSEKSQNVVMTEVANVVQLQTACLELFNGNKDKISEITKKSEEALKAISFASLLAVPGAITVLPSIVKTAKSYKLNIIPESVVSQFGI